MKTNRHFITLTDVAGSLGQDLATVKRWALAIGVPQDSLSGHLHATAGDLTALATIAWLKTATPVPRAAVKPIARDVIRRLGEGKTLFLFVELTRDGVLAGLEGKKTLLSVRRTWINLGEFAMETARSLEAAAVGAGERELTPIKGLPKLESFAA